MDLMVYRVWLMLFLSKKDVTWRWMFFRRVSLRWVLRRRIGLGLICLINGRGIGLKMCSATRPYWFKLLRSTPWRKTRFLWFRWDGGWAFSVWLAQYSSRSPIFVNISMARWSCFQRGLFCADWILIFFGKAFLWRRNFFFWLFMMFKLDYFLRFYWLLFFVWYFSTFLAFFWVVCK